MRTMTPEQRSESARKAVNARWAKHRATKAAVEEYAVQRKASGKARAPRKAQAMKKHLVIAVDFDGTCVEHAFPDIGPDMPHAVEVLRELVSLGHKIVLWTCREDHPTKISKRHLSSALAWFVFRDIPLRSVNETHLEDEFRDHEGPLGRGRKVYADIYVDDKNLGGFPGWKAVLAEVARLTT